MNWQPADESIGYMMDDPSIAFRALNSSVVTTSYVRGIPVLQAVVPDWMAVLDGFDEWRSSLDYAVITRSEDIAAMREDLGMEDD